MTCRHLIDFIAAYLDDELPARQAMAFRMHLAMCSQCRSYLDSYKKTVALGKAALHPSNDPVPKQVPADLVKAILAARRAKSSD